MVPGKVALDPRSKVKNQVEAVRVYWHKREVRSIKRKEQVY